MTIIKKGSEPALITVKKGEQSWEITDKELDKLPADVRKHVEPMLAPHHTMTKSYFKTPTANALGPNPIYYQHSFQEANRPVTPYRSAIVAQPVPKYQLQERQEVMLKQLQQLTEKVEKLQQAIEKSSPKP